MIFDQFDPTALQADAVRNAPTGTASENFFAAMKRYDYVDSSIASRLVLRDIWDPIVAEVNSATGSNFESPLYAGEQFSGVSGDYQGQALSFFDFVKKAEKEKPGSISPKIMELMSLEAIDAAVISEARRSVSEYDAVSKNSESFTNGAVSFMGSLAAGAKDPFNVALMLGTMGIGTGVNAAKTLGTIALREALINGGGEALRQPLVASWYKEIGLNYTAENFAMNVGSAAVLGAIIPVGIIGTGRAVSRGIDINAGLTKPSRALIDFLDSSEPQLQRLLTPDQILSGVETLKSSGVKISRESDAAIVAARDLLDLEASNPIAGNPTATILDHSSTMASAQHSLFNGEVPKIKAVPIEMVKPEAILEQANNLDGFVFRFNPNEIGVDAKTFQFKMGGDAFGVSERLRGVKVWDPILGGEILVYEFADGRMFVADGHQRLGLAKRIMSEDPAQNVVIYGRKLREADGVTPEQAMVVAAIKNIAEGSGSAIDAAKVARIDPAGFSSLIGKTLPPSSVLVRQANDMINLTDNAFGAIINEVIPANYGAIIGRVLGDRKDLQDAAVKILAKSEPANVFQAEAIVRQVREADAEQVQQFSLFGEETVTESLFVERAKILDQAYRQLKQDKATFANLTRNADRIEAEGGNVLDRQLNEQKATQDAQTIALLQTLANRKGPVSDALSAAARGFRDTGSYGRPTRDFLESVRNAIATGDLDRISSSDIGRTLDGPSPGSADTVGKEPVLDGFEEPNGVAAEQQINQMTRDMFPEPAAAVEAAPAQANVDTLFPLNAPAGSNRSLVVAKDLTGPEMRGLQEQAKGRQPNDAVSYMAMATKNHNDLNDAAEKIASDLGIDFRRAPLKKLGKIDTKLENKGKPGEYSTISDAARTGISARSMSESDAFVAGLAKQFNLIDEGWIVTGAGYFDRKLMVVFDDGGVGEIQIWPPGMLAAKENPSKFGPSGHDMYDVWNNKNTSAEVRAKLEGQMKEIYAEVASKLDPSFAEKLGIAAPTAPSTPATSPGSISSALSSDNVIPTSAGVPVQPDLALQQSAASPSMATMSESLFTKNRMIPSSGETLFELTPAGQQSLIPGVDVVTQQQIMQVAGSKPMRGGTAALPEGGLFDQVAIMQRDLLDELQSTDTISVGLVQDTNGNIVSQTMTMAEIKTMMDAEDQFIKQLGICGI